MSIEEDTSPDPCGKCGADEKENQSVVPSVDEQMTDSRFARFQVWAAVGIIVATVLLSIQPGRNERSVFILIVLAVGIICIAGCMTCLRYNKKKLGVVFLVLPVLLLFGGLFFLPGLLGMGTPDVDPRYKVMNSIRAALMVSDEELQGREVTIYGLYFGRKTEGTEAGIIEKEIALSDYFYCSSDQKRSYKGYWYSLVKRNHHGVPFSDVPDSFAICAFPEQYGMPGRYVYLMDEKGNCFRKDFNDVRYIKVFPGPDPCDREFGWEKVVVF